MCFGLSVVFPTLKTCIWIGYMGMWAMWAMWDVSDASVNKTTINKYEIPKYTSITNYTKNIKYEL